MAIPDLTNEGVLPDGIHACSLDEIQERFGQFQRTDRRCRLFEKLKAYVTEACESGIVAWLAVDGSFVTGKPDPGDVDLIVVLPAEHDFRIELRPDAYNVLSRRRARKRHGIDVLVAAEGTPELLRYLAFFHETRNRPGLRKGILKVKV